MAWRTRGRLNKRRQKARRSSGRSRCKTERRECGRTVLRARLHVYACLLARVEGIPHWNSTSPLNFQSRRCLAYQKAIQLAREAPWGIRPASKASTQAHVRTSGYARARTHRHSHMYASSPNPAEHNGKAPTHRIRTRTRKGTDVE
jgi:hypothetical protein